MKNVSDLSARLESIVQLDNPHLRSSIKLNPVLKYLRCHERLDNGFADEYSGLSMECYNGWLNIEHKDQMPNREESLRLNPDLYHSQIDEGNLIELCKRRSSVSLGI